VTSGTKKKNDMTWHVKWMDEEKGYVRERRGY